MNFLDINFPKDIAFDAIGGPEFSTNIIQTVNGNEIRNINWQNPIRKYNITYGLKTSAQIKKLSDLFLQVKGRANGFRFRDWFDFNAYDQELKQIDNEGKKFQFIKNYGDDINKYERKITKLVQDSIQIKKSDNSIIYDEKSDIKKIDTATIDYNTGIVTFNAAPGSNLTAIFEFDVPVRFDIDYLPIKIKGKNDFICEDIYLVEIQG